MLSVLLGESARLHLANSFEAHRKLSSSSSRKARISASVTLKGGAGKGEAGEEGRRGREGEEGRRRAGEEEGK